MKIKVIILFFLFPAFGYSQTDTIAHLHAYGGGNNDVAEEIEATIDGGYIVIGSTSSNSSGNTDAYLLKVDSNCGYQWSYALGGINNDWGYSVKQTFDKGYIIGVSSNSYGNGGYDACLMKRDSLGNYEWKKCYGGNDWDLVYSVAQTHDSGYVFCGETYNNTNGFSDVYVVKTNQLGDTIWTRTVGGALVDKGNSIIETSDSNIVVAGVKNTLVDSTQIYVLKFDFNGTLLWDSVYGDSLYENLNQIIQTADGDYAMVGSTNSLSTGGDQDYLIKKISRNGNWLWDFTIVNGPSPTPQDEEALALVELSNNYLLISGYSMTGANSKNIAFFQLKPDGNWAGVSSVYSSVNDDLVNSVSIGVGGSILGAGITMSFGSGLEDVLLIKLDTIYSGQDTSMTGYPDIIPLNVNTKYVSNEIIIYPNPVKDKFEIDFKNLERISHITLYDITGQIVYSKDYFDEEIDISHLTKGIYLLVVNPGENERFQTKIIKY